MTIHIQEINEANTFQSLSEKVNDYKNVELNDVQLNEINEALKGVEDENEIERIVDDHLVALGYQFSMNSYLWELV